MCVCLCVCTHSGIVWNELYGYAKVVHTSSSFHPFLHTHTCMHAHPHTCGHTHTNTHMLAHILTLFEDCKPMGLKVDIASS